MRLIGVAGEARAGKDTAARCLAAKHRMKHAAFANPLKEVAALLAGEPVEYFHDDVKKGEFCEALGMTRRRAMQLLGNEAIKPHFGNDVWLKVLMREWAAAGRPDTVVSDVRFDHEAAAIRAAGGVVVRLARAGAGLTGDAAAHASEAGVSPHLVDFVITNDGTVEELHAKLDTLVALDLGA